ncbi:MAG: tetratricopeptide repeat protein [Alphaproteobacteria bacterium]
MRQIRMWAAIGGLLGVLAAPLAATLGRAETPPQQLLEQAEQARRARNLVEAEQLFRRVLQSQAEPRVQAQAMNGLGHVLFNQGRVDEAERTIDAARAIIVKNFGDGDILMASNWQAHGLIRLQKYKDRAGAQAAIEKASAIRNAKLDVWTLVGDRKALRYTPAGLELPMQSGSLNYLNRAIHDDSGQDVSVNYDGTLASGASLRVTVYAYRLSPGARADLVFRQEIDGIQAFNRSARLLHSETFPLDAPGRDAVGRRALFRYQGQGVTVDTRLYLFLFGQWAIKLRVTGDAADAAAIDEQVAALLRAIVWPN